MAGYHCLMPTAFSSLQYNTNITANGIFFVAIQYKHNGLRHFLRCNTTPNSRNITFTDISFFEALHILPNTPRQGIEPLAQGNTLGKRKGKTGTPYRGTSISPDHKG